MQNIESLFLNLLGSTNSYKYDSYSNLVMMSRISVPYKSDGSLKEKH